ncbi:Eco57I restriction-modification methylase domain-containing protein [Streptomyces sp. NPDC003035]|uniref:Eco57I restriction-modification methylase domain-containing protein n=1 Tax=Streptomyces sp. NPDC003035 TaxID=3364676 RepID=UPI0036A67D31
MLSPAAVAPADQECPPNHGAVFTRRWVVELILDLCEYVADRDLTRIRAVEPAAGAGAFLTVMVERLLRSRKLHAGMQSWSDLAPCLRAWDLQENHVASCRLAVTETLQAAGCPREEARELAEAWVQQGDFLLLEHEEKSADLVVGNPPYIRIEDLSPKVLAAYRKACPTMAGRADIYIGFFEKAMTLLKPESKLGFICADRWMRNQYGRRLREKIATEGYAVDVSLIMHDVQAFDESVSAYPAITILRRGIQESAVLGNASDEFGESAARRFASWAIDSEAVAWTDPTVTAARLPHWHEGGDSWPEGSPALIAWLEELAGAHPPLEDEETATRISIGVASGADRVYVTTDSEAAEPERMLRLSMASDIKSGKFVWGGRYLVNPWDTNGLVDLADWPRLRGYLSRHGEQVRGRAIARKNEATWYRTIDRVSMSLTARPMLLLQDMKSHIHPVLAPAGYYPHHNLYYVTSDVWDLEVLGGLLLSEAVERQVEAYCVKMRGGTMRFQAQYLRRVRVPQLSSLPEEVRDELRRSFQLRDRQRASAAALRAYGILELPR